MIAVVGRRAALAAGIACVVVGLGRIVGPLPPSFYGTVAQVLPVFLLVAIVEGRYFSGLDGRDAFSRFVLRGLLMLVLGGEAAALVIVARESDEVVLRGIVLGAIGCAALLIWLYASVGPARPPAVGIAELADRVRAANRKTDA